MLFCNRRSVDRLKKDVNSASRCSFVSVFLLIALITFGSLSMAAQPAYAVNIPQTVAGVPAQMDTSKYTQTVQLPVTLYDYGRMIDGQWVTKAPAILNMDLDAVDCWTVLPVDFPATMRFWDTSYKSWTDPKDTSSMLTSEGHVLAGGGFGWGLFSRQFNGWSDIILAESRDLFGTDPSTCSYNGEIFKQVYENVMMDFSYDPNTNSYHYSSNESKATFNGESRIIKSELGEDATTEDVGFWPFGNGEVHFGMTMDFDFYLPTQEYLDANEYYFAFSGDDDLVVYVDDVLTLDLGGAHRAVAGYIDFSNEIVVYGVNESDIQAASFDQQVEKSDIEFIRSGFDEAGIDWNMETLGYVTFEELGIDLEKSSTHNFKLAYLERGGNESNLMIEMNMVVDAEVMYEVVGEDQPDANLTDPIPVEDSELYLYDTYVAKESLTTTDSGWTFSGWYEDEECTQEWEDGSPLLSETTILYGKWDYGELSKTSDPTPGTTLLPNDTISYTLTYQNQKDYSEKVVIEDLIPAGTTYIDSTLVADGADNVQFIEGKSDSRGLISCTWDSLEPLEIAQVEFEVRVDPSYVGEVITNYATATVDNGSYVYTSPIIDHPVTSSGLRIIKSSDPQEGSSVESGQIISYTVELINEGDVSIRDLVLLDAIPEYTTYCEDSAVVSGTNMEYEVVEYEVELGLDGVLFSEIETLNPQESVVLTFQVVVDELEIGEGEREIRNVSQVASPSLEDKDSETPGILYSNEVVHIQNQVELEEPIIIGKNGDNLPKTSDSLLSDIVFISVGLACVAGCIVAIVVAFQRR